MFYDRWSIPLWVEALGVLIMGIVFGCMFALSI